MRSTTVYDCNLIELPKVRAASGNITSVNGGIELPFEIRRCYYLYDIPSGEARGGHAHRALHQFIVAASGLEVLDHIITCMDLAIISESQYTDFRIRLDELLNKLNAYYRHLVRNGNGSLRDKLNRSPSDKLL